MGFCAWGFYYVFEDFGFFEDFDFFEDFGDVDFYCNDDEDFCFVDVDFCYDSYVEIFGLHSYFLTVVYLC